MTPAELLGAWTQALVPMAALLFAVALTLLWKGAER